MRTNKRLAWVAESHSLNGRLTSVIIVNIAKIPIMKRKTMSKCEECGLEDEHKMSCDSTFDEEAWDEKRQSLESEVCEAVLELSDYMGCNSFTLPCDELIIKVTPSSA